jgi:hypothetical protein
MAKAMPRPWTVEDFLAFEPPEEERYELVTAVRRTARQEGITYRRYIRQAVERALDRR